MTTRTDNRADFLAGVLTTAIEGGINYWASVSDYRWGFKDLGTSDGGQLVNGSQAYASATIHELEEDEKTYEVDIETIARGLSFIKQGRAGIASSTRANIMLADRTNGDDGDIDAGDADCILQAGIFGEVIYG